MTSRERRKHVRIQRQFEARLFNAKVRYETEGLTENISQGGVYVKTRDWRSFRSGDQAIVTLFLPPSFTDRDKIFGLRGNAIVRRVDEKNEGVALEFSRDDFRAALSSRLLGSFGLLSYSIYLWQQPLLRLTGSVPAALLVVAAIILGAASFLLVERPARRWLNGLGTVSAQRA